MRAWEEFLSEQERVLGEETVKKWLRPLRVIRFDACNLYLEADDSFKALWFEEHMRHRAESLLNNNNKQIKVHVGVAVNALEEEKRSKKKSPSSHALPSFELSFDTLDDKSRLENFITSQGNLLGFKLLCDSCHLNPQTLQKEEATSSPLSFNPIYLFGRKGTGKTHLLMATARSLRESGLSALYVRAETFTEHVVNAIRTGEMQAFRKTYRHVDALLIDDIEVFSRKGATQEEFFHTFNTLHVEGKQIVLSASSPPQELKFIEQRLVSRFEWGIVIPLQVVGKEEMRKLLFERAKSFTFHLEEKIAQFLIDTFGSNAKSLIKALEALVLRCHLHAHLHRPSSPITLEKAKVALADLIAEEEKSSLTATKIIRSVAEHYGIRIDDILSKSQSRETTLPRQIAMHLCRSYLQLPFMKIGDIFSRDHSTVMTSVKQIQKGVEDKNPEIITPLSHIQKRLEHV